MSDTIRSEVAFAVDGVDERDAKTKTIEAVKSAGFEVVGVGEHPSKLIDYLPGEYLVKVVIEHVENELNDLAGHAKGLYDDLVKAGLKPHSQPGSGFLAADDSRLRGAQPHESDLLNDSGQNTDPHNDSSQLVRDAAPESVNADDSKADARDREDADAPALDEHPNKGPGPGQLGVEGAGASGGASADEQNEGDSAPEQTPPSGQGGSGEIATA